MDADTVYWAIFALCVVVGVYVIFFTDQRNISMAGVPPAGGAGGAPAAPKPAPRKPVDLKCAGAWAARRGRRRRLAGLGEG